MADIELVVGEAHLAVDTAGGGLRALRVGGWDVLDGYPAGTVPHGRRGHVLAPWPNRLARGRYAWDGVDHRVPITDAAHDAAIHGFVDALEWVHTGGYQDESRGEIGMAVAMAGRDGYPWPLSLEVQYVLQPTMLETILVVTNRGTSDAPLGVGMHPYLSVGADADGTSVSLPVTHRLPLDEQGAPSGPLEAFDGELGVIGDRVLDVPLTGLHRADGWASAILTGPAGALTLSVDEAWPWLQLFTADTLPGDERRRSVALEPNTCPPNAFATGTDVVRLAAGASWRGAWRLAWEPAGS
jgi:aldose 1-epimerase